MKNKLTRSNIVEIVLVVIAMLSWLVNRAGGLSSPILGAITAFSLGIAMGFLGRSFIAQKGASRKLAGVLVLAFGLFNVFVGIMEIYSFTHGV